MCDFNYLFLSLAIYKNIFDITNPLSVSKIKKIECSYFNAIPIL